MFIRLTIAFGIIVVMSSGSAAQMKDGPYKEESANLIYQLLFCDRLQLFKEHHDGKVEGPWATLFNADLDVAAITKIAEDAGQEARVRMLAFNRLRTAGRPAATKVYLGTIIEVHLADGLDTLAVFADGGVRYINYTGKMSVVEGSPSAFDHEISEVINASKPIVAAIGPWDKERLAPPKTGNLRMTFLVSDGLYFGEGPIETMQRERLAAPLIAAATKLLVKLVEHK